MQSIRVLLGFALVSAFADAGSARSQANPRTVDWAASISPQDRGRLRDWRAAWLAALANARKGGAGDRIAAAGILLQPDAAIASPPAPDGDYRCRVIKLGARDPDRPVYVETPGYTCRIAAGRFVKLDGPQRPAGRLWPLDGMRSVFLGAMALGDEAAALDYGRDDQRDMIGLFECIGPRRWRLVLPKPRWESLFDVIELVPMP